MFVRHVLFDLDGSPLDRDALLGYLKAESVDAFAQVPGLRLKLWIYEDETNRWGAIYIWESRAAFAAASPLPSRAGELIGHGPSVVNEYDVEAAIEGVFTSAVLSKVGRAYDA